MKAVYKYHKSELKCLVGKFASIKWYDSKLIKTEVNPQKIKD